MSWWRLQKKGGMVWRISSDAFTLFLIVIILIGIVSLTIVMNLAAQ